jgi:signal transduction histidine kinase/CheY-like chemotaxis protein/HPt (histidine-containing phosphotransfer) domain-containing protein
MRSWYAKLSLRTKITLIALAITILSLAGVASIGIIQISREISAEQHRTADSVARAVARASQLAISVGDTRELNRIASAFLRDESVLFVAIYPVAGGKPLAVAVRESLAWQQFETGTVDQRRGMVGTYGVEAVADSDEFSGEVDADPNAPPAARRATKPQLAGQAVVCISTLPTIEAQQQQIRLTVQATAIAAVLGAGVLFLTLRPSMRRLAELAVAAHSISHGNFDHSIADEHQDEIGRLSDSLEQMRLAVRDRDGQLRKFADTLKEQVKQRTSDLEAALAAAEHASRAKSMFLANMSHELRTPLNGVIGMVDLLLNANPSAQQRRYCEVAKSSARSLLDLINDILDFSKIEAGKLDLDSVDFDLHGIVEGVTQVVGDAADRKKIELICSVGEAVPRTVRGDPTRLRQVALNLVSNAIKFTERGEVVIKLGLEEQDQTHATVRLSVKDSGIGIPRDRIERLFKSFSQVDASTTRKFGGTGLGLAISHRIIELMGGQIGVESEEGKGSTFWIRLRLEKRQGTVVPARPIGVDPRGLRVLVVDDNSTNREILQAQLASWHLQADTAGSAADALRMLDSAVEAGAPYRFALLDMRMPTMDGFELAQVIRSRPKLGDLILISLSSMGEQMSGEQMSERGFAACLTKPALPSQLYDTLVDSLAHQKPAPAPVPARTAPVVENHRGIRLDGARVLVAEDNAVNRFVASELLTSAGCTCDCAVNGLEAVEKALNETHDVILMDCQMPELDGFEASKAIREAERNSADGKHRPIIALTANAIKGDRELCLAAGMDDYVTKPIDPVELLGAIRRHVPVGVIRMPPVGLPTGTTAAAPAAIAPDAVVDPPIDLNMLEQRCMGNRKLAAKALKMFESSLGKEIESLLNGVTHNDAQAVAAAAHKIKGSAANVSAERVRAVAAELETLGRTDALARATESLAVLDRETRQFQQYLATALSQLSPPPELPIPPTVTEQA